MKTVIVLAVVAFAVIKVSAAEPTYENDKEDWEKFKADYKKSYKDGAEESFRKNIYLRNHRKIIMHNKLIKDTPVPYYLKMNSFGDLVESEFNALMNENKNGARARSTDNETLRLPIPKNTVIRKFINWNETFSTPVRDQGSCKSSWAISAVGAVEYQYLRQNRTAVDLSEQNLIDCSHSFGNYGCRGGSTSGAFNYIKANRGIENETTYPYKQEDGVCRFKPRLAVATIKDFVTIPKGREDVLQQVVATVGPVSVAIDASSYRFQFYSRGVYSNPYCSAGRPVHSVLVVGYGTFPTRHGYSAEYWIVKSSVGTGWGLDGYMTIVRNRHNHCGIASNANYPVV